MEKGALFSVEFEKEKLLFVIYKHLLIKMKRLKTLVHDSLKCQTEVPAENVFGLLEFQEYIAQDSFKQLQQAITQYE